MKHCFFISQMLCAGLLAAALLLAGCASLPPANEGNSIRLQTQDGRLRGAAQQSLHGAGVYIDNDNSALPLLQLSEAYNNSIESLAADGSIGSYQISYTLTYQLDDKPSKQIKREQVIDHDENHYRASTSQQKQMVESLRRSALAQMIISLQLHQRQ